MRETRLYAPFYRDDRGKYRRLTLSAHRKSNAVRIYQDMLLRGSFAGLRMYLRPVHGDVAPHEIEVNQAEFFAKVKTDLEVGP